MLNITNHISKAMLIVSARRVRVNLGSRINFTEVTMDISFLEYLKLEQKRLGIDDLEWCNGSDFVQLQKIKAGMVQPTKSEFKAYIRMILTRLKKERI